MFQILENKINEGLETEVREQTQTVLIQIFHTNADASNFSANVELFNDLWLNTHTKTPDMAYYILAGLIDYTHTAEGKFHSILLNDMAIKALDHFIETAGWSIIRNCVIILHKTLNNIYHEPVFKYIVSRVTSQLTADTLTIAKMSKLCYNLPRERSYKWGWFSYIIANAYYSPIEYENATLTKSQFRRNLMNYRKLITYLRKNTEPPAYKVEAFTYTETPPPPTTDPLPVDIPTVDIPEEKNNNTSNWLFKWLGW